MIGGDKAIPEKPPKRPRWNRILDIALRTAHVAVIGILLGGAVFAVPTNRLFPWYTLAIATGCALIASELCHSRHWPYQGRGIIALTHIGLLGLIHLRPDLRVPLLLAILALGMVGSHMPKNFRHWSFRHGRVIE